MPPETIINEGFNIPRDKQEIRTLGIRANCRYCLHSWRELITTDASAIVNSKWYDQCTLCKDQGAKSAS